MYEFETFAYLDVPKTGSSFISEVLRRFCTEKRVRKITHGEFRGGYDSGKFYFMSVRDPLDQYISLYSFGCQGEGELFYRMARLGLAGLYDSTWSGFEFWLAQILDPVNGLLLGREYERCAGLLGFQSYRVFRLAVPDFRSVTGNCHTVSELREVYEARNIINYVVRYESLRDDTCMLLREKLGESMRAGRAIRHIQTAPPANPSDRVDRYERDPQLRPKTRRLLAEREWLLNEYFGYGRSAENGAGEAVGKDSAVGRDCGPSLETL